MEIWKTVEGTCGMIEVSNQGRMRSNLRTNGFVLKLTPDSKGYQRVKVTINKEKHSFKVHREVAKAFIANPLNLPQVNHIDGNKSNNSVENLEWVSNKDNVRHAISSGLWDSVIAGSLAENEKRKKSIIGTKDGIKKVFGSISEAEHFVGSRHITDVLKGKRNKASGWKFEYMNRGDSECPN